MHNLLCNSDLARASNKVLNFDHWTHDCGHDHFEHRIYIAGNYDDIAVMLHIIIIFKNTVDTVSNIKV